MKRRRTTPAAPRQGTALLDGLFRRLGLAEEARQWRALRAFYLAAGEKITARVRGERMHGSTMVLRVASAAWAHELSYMKASLLEKLRATPGGEWVKDLRFAVGPLEEAPDWSDEPPKQP